MNSPGSKSKYSIVSIVLLVIFLTPFSTHDHEVSAQFGGFTFETNPAVYLSTSYLANKESWIDATARGFAQFAFQAMTQLMIESIRNGGRGGGPNFVRDWRNYLTEGQYRGEDVFRSILAYTPTCSYLQSDINAQFNVTNFSYTDTCTVQGSQCINSCNDQHPSGSPERLSCQNNCAANEQICNQNNPPQTQTASPFTNTNIRVGDLNPFTLRGKCTLPTGFDIDSYINDFSGNGGWQAWDRLLEPQNNYFSLYLMSLDESERQRSLDAAADLNEALSGQGFTSTRDICQDQLSGDVQGPSLPSAARCRFMGQVFTPASVLGQNTANTIDQELSWITSSDEITEVLFAIVGAVIGRLTNVLGG